MNPQLFAKLFRAIDAWADETYEDYTAHDSGGIWIEEELSHQMAKAAAQVADAARDAQIHKDQQEVCGD